MRAQVRVRCLVLFALTVKQSLPRIFHHVHQLFLPNHLLNKVLSASGLSVRHFSVEQLRKQKVNKRLFVQYHSMQKWRVILNHFPFVLLPTRCLQLYNGGIPYSHIAVVHVILRGSLVTWRVRFPSKTSSVFLLKIFLISWACAPNKRVALGFK